ncbi:MAG TPA: DUF72 domain-containing protein [Chloroflexia bacterium]|nr:DUF72 domain-containing protein [Chloroflexia bacterium]
MIHIGTSGYSYQDWKGPVYPENIKDNEMLAFYAQHFNTTEINYTYYRMPAARTLQAMASKVPDDFIFTIKASKELTHEREEAEEGGGTPENFRLFREALQPLIDENKFGAVLAQFPNSFKPTQENTDYLETFRERMGDLPVVVEFRNAGWVTDDTFELLRKNNLGYCCVDEPRLKGLIPPIAVATSPIAYVRFHGRNAQKWWQHDEAYERYSYEYSPEELQEWVPKIEKLDSAAPNTFIFTNNHYRGAAVRTAEQLRDMLAKAGEKVH